MPATCRKAEALEVWIHERAGAEIRDGRRGTREPRTVQGRLPGSCRCSCGEVCQHRPPKRQSGAGRLAGAAASWGGKRIMRRGGAGRGRGRGCISRERRATRAPGDDDQGCGECSPPRTAGSSVPYRCAIRWPSPSRVRQHERGSTDFGTSTRSELLGVRESVKAPVGAVTVPRGSPGVRMRTACLSRGRVRGGPSSVSPQGRRRRRRPTGGPGRRGRSGLRRT